MFTAPAVSCEGGIVVRGGREGEEGGSGGEREREREIESE